MNKKCQVFTPANYVKELLDSVGYIEQLYGKKVLENSCGDGNILVEVVQRYIDDCRSQGLSSSRIRSGLERDIYGVEIDPEQCEKCIGNLNLVLERNDITQVKWNIYNHDYLRFDLDVKFSYIVGNPPYITYKELKVEEQKYVKANFKTCEKGKFDYCYAFIEKGIKSLCNTGKLVYLIPSSIFKTVFGANLRKYMKPYLEEIKDYTQEKMFDNALIKSSIMILNHNRIKKYFHYVDMTTGIDINISTEDLSDKWFFTKNLYNGNKRFGDYFHVSHVIATLLNEAFVLKKSGYEETENHIICKGHKIEKTIIRETATPRSLRYRKEEKIIFPYNYFQKKLIRYSEEEFKEKFPGAVGYLSEYRDKLDKRKKDDTAKWYEYGRTQALSRLYKEKLIVSTIITEKVFIYKLSKECIPYAGMYIVLKDSNTEFSLDDAIRILSSREFMQYVLDVGIHISGCSLRITSKDIEDYRF